MKTASYHAPVGVAKVKGTAGPLLANGHTQWVEGLAVSYETKHPVTTWPSAHALWCFCHPKKLETSVYAEPCRRVSTAAFLHNRHSLDTTKMPLGRWVEEAPVVHPDNGLLLRDTKKWAIKPLKDRRSLKCTLLSERRQPATWHSGESQTGDHKKIGAGGGGMSRRSQGLSRAALFWEMLSRRVQDITLWSSPQTVRGEEGTPVQTVGLRW